MSSPNVASPIRAKQPASPGGRRGQNAAEKSRGTPPAEPTAIPIAEKPAASARLDVQVAGSRKEVVFRYDAPSAARVALAADFTGWDKSPIALSKGRDGIWQIRVALDRGQHHYKFLVDGEWRMDPNCRMQKPNGFGTNNAVIEIS